MANAPIVVGDGDDDIEVEYDSDGNPMVSERSKVIDPLPPIDHSAVRLYYLSSLLLPLIFF